MIGLFLVLIAIFVLALAITTYNTLIQMQNGLEKSKSDIRVSQKKCNVLISKMVSSVGVASDKELNAINNATNVQAKFQMVRALAQQYPDIKTTAAYTQMNQQMQPLLDDIASKQEEYNKNVEVFNTQISTFPNVIFATLLGFKKANFIDQDNLDKATDLGDVGDIDDITII